MKGTAWRFLPILVATTALGCPFAMYSKPYEPPDADEVRALAAARRDVFPDDIREDPAAHQETVVAWAGIVREGSPNGARPGSVLVTAEHHYFDWLEDHSARPEWFLLSPRGEGPFRFELGPGDPLFDRVQSDPALLVGLMVVVIGKPRVSDRPAEPLSVLPDHVRFFRRKWFRTDVLDYGRE